MTGYYMGVYWIDRKDQMPEEDTLCVFHIKGRKAVRNRGCSILFGAYTGKYGFFSKTDSEWYPKSRIDYWMPIPVLPEKEK